MGFGNMILVFSTYQYIQGVIFPAGARVFPAGNMYNLKGNLANNSRIFMKRSSKFVIFYMEIPVTKRKFL
jgi:hypothetical protein